MIKLVVFDLDGTLLDTIEDLGDSVNEVLSARGYPEHTYDKYRLFIGDGMKKLILRALPSKAKEDPVLVSDVLAEYQAAYERNWRKKSCPYAGITNCLRELQTTGTRSAILSNKPHRFTEMCVSHLLSEFNFDKVYGEREGVPRKPDPAGALAICRELDILPQETMFVGDTSVDVLTGVRAGMMSVGVLWGFRGEEELRDSGAEHIISHPNKLLGLMGFEE